MAPGPKASPGPLRLIHLVVFLGFAAATVAGVHPELTQLFRALTRPFHSGTPPHPIATAAGIVAALLALVLIAYFARGRSAPLGVSIAVLIAFACGFFVLEHEPVQRSTPGANLKAIDAATAVFKRIDGELQKTGRVPDEVKEESASPYRKRPFTALTWRVRVVDVTSVLPDGAEPGWLLLRVSTDRASFVLTAVGIDDAGQPSLLRHEGNPIELRSVFNPDMGM